MQVYTVLQTENFIDWFNSIKDIPTRIRLARRLDRARSGNLGDIKFLAQGVYEMREQFGPGWRMYDVMKDQTIIVMLGGGNKSTQSADIKAAQSLAALLEP
jgi:putative addiction module killer protein